MRLNQPLILILIILSFIGCSSPQEEPRLIRIVDTLADADILESPVIGLQTRFEIQETTITTDMLARIEIDSESPYSVYGFMLNHPVLAPQAAAAPPECRLTAGGKTWRYSAGIQPGPHHWTLLRRQRTIPINKALYPGESIETDILLPVGEVAIRYRIERAGTVRPEAVLDLSMDDRPLARQSTSEEFSTRASTDFKQHRLRLKYLNSLDPVTGSSPKMEVHISELRIESPSDILLIVPPADTGSRDQEFNFTYRKSPAIPSKQGGSKAEPSGFYKLYDLIHSPGHLLNDRGVRNTSIPLKKKLYVKGRAINTILAAPPTRFQWHERIPKGGSLEFGIGCLENLVGKDP